MKKRSITYLIITLLCGSLSAQTPVEHPDRHKVTYISPYYFGPNAFAIPDMLDGNVSRTLHAEIAMDHFIGKRGDHTTDASLKINIPLFTDRVNLSAWMPVVETWRNSDENIEACHLSDKEGSNPRIRKGHGVGDLFICTDIQLLREGDLKPAVAIRAALKTASSDDDYCTARFYDSPGYFFDATVGKTLPLQGEDRFFKGLRCAVSAGFLCWQTDNGRQNDAIMFGIQAKLLTKAFNISESFGGYNGWENSITNGGESAHDQPLSLKTRLCIHAGCIDIIANYQYGIRDYPYQQIAIGLAWDLDVLSPKN